MGHRGVEGIYRRVGMRFWWLVLSRTFKSCVASCVACQKRSSLRPKEIGHTVGKDNLFTLIDMIRFSSVCNSYV